MKTKTGLTLLVCVALLSACGGGGGKISSEGKNAALSLCDPPSGPAGTKVVCQANGMTVDDTLLFDGHPIEGAVNEADGAVAFVVPTASLPGGKKVAFGGGSEIHSITTFEVTGAEGPSEGAIAPSAVGTPSGTDEVITAPSTGGTGTGGTTTGGTTGGSTGGLADADGDGIPDVSDSCPGTPSGATVDSKGCPPPPPPAAFSVKIKATKMFDTHLGLVKVEGTVSGGTGDIADYYVYSGGFYRVESDKTDPNPCGKITSDIGYSSNGSRNLLVHSDGNDLYDGTTNYDQWSNYLSSAKPCKDDGSNCNGYTAALAVIDHPPVCRMDLKDKGGAFLKKDQTFTLYTRVLDAGQAFHVYAKTSNGEEASDASDVITGDPVDVSTSASIAGDKVTLTANYTGVLLRPSPSPLAASPTGPNLTNKGAGIYSGTYPFVNGTLVSFLLRGIGETNVVTKTYKVDISNSATVTLKDFGNHNAIFTNGCGSFQDCKGTLSLQATVAGSGYSIKDEKGDSLASGATMVGIGDVNLYANGDKFIATKPVGGGTVTFDNVPRDYDHYVWYAKVGSVKSNELSSGSDFTPYVAKITFKTTNVDGSLTTHFSSGDDGDCNDYDDCGHNAVEKGDMEWADARHIKDITANCFKSGGNRGVSASANIDKSQLSDYGPEGGGGITMVMDAGTPDDYWNAVVQCDFTATTYDGSTITSNGWWMSIDCHES
jgi:hypothetical protein